MITKELKQGGQYRIMLTQANEAPIEFTLRNSIGDPIDLTGLTLEMTWKISLFDDAPAYTFPGTVTGAEDGILTFAVTDVETADVRVFIAEIIATDGASYTENLFLFQMEVRRAA